MIIITTQQNIFKEIIDKKDRVTQIIENNNLDGVYLTKNVNFSWFFAGAEHYIDISSEKSASRILITKNDIIVESDNIEKSRLENEELRFDELIDYDMISWYEERKSKAGNFGYDNEEGNHFCVSDQIKKLRMQLTPNEVERYKKLAKQTGNIIEEVAKNIKVGISEYQIASKLAQKCYKKGIIPVVNLVAVDDRVFKYRHPLPKNNTLKKYAMLVICAKKWGLVANATRLVHFGPLSEELNNKYKVLQDIEKIFLDNSQPGNSLKDIFRNSIKQYEKVGYPEEWKKHHQGGLTGYNSREIIADFDTDYIIKENQAFAWNPSITGTKIEDTFLLKNDSLESITETGNWDYNTITIQNKKTLRPNILIRNN